MQRLELPAGLARVAQALVTGLCLLGLPAKAADGLAPGTAAPKCTGTPMGEGPVFDFASTGANKVIYVDFWASWCGPCARAFPFLNALDREYRERGLHVVGINVDERVEDAQRFLRRYRAGFSVLKDSGGACPRAYRVLAMPTSYLIDRRGIVREVHTGFRDGDAEQRRAQIEKLLADDSAPGAVSGKPPSSTGLTR